MKCEKCNNEAVYYYKETVNGKTTEKHLCADCAQKEGLDRAFDLSGESFFRDFDREFESFFASDPFFGNLPGDGFFRSPMSTMARTMLAPMFTLPRIEIGTIAPEKKTEGKPAETAQTGTAPEDKACDALRQRREMNALKHKLQEAVKAENFEEAITLRDQIRAMEKTE